MLCALPAGNTQLLSPVTMLNILGDAWLPDAPNWPAVLSESSAHVHLYGKAEARGGRKMGHVNCLAENSAASVHAAEKVRKQL